MGKKLTDKALAKFEAERDVWQEVLDSVREIKAGEEKRTKVEAKPYIVRVRLKRELFHAKFAAALGVSKRTLEQSEQGRGKLACAAKRLPISVLPRESYAAPDDTCVYLRLHDY
jgi:putative transcriptional regulator